MTADDDTLIFLTGALAGIVAALAQACEREGLDAADLLRRYAEPFLVDRRVKADKAGDDGRFAEAKQLILAKAMLEAAIDDAIKSLGAKPH